MRWGSEVAYEAGVLQAGDDLRGQGSCLMRVGSGGRCLVGKRRIDRVSHGDWIASLFGAWAEEFGMEDRSVEGGVKVG